MGEPTEDPKKKKDPASTEQLDRIETTGAKILEKLDSKKEEPIVTPPVVDNKTKAANDDSLEDDDDADDFDKFVFGG